MDEKLKIVKITSETEFTNPDLRSIASKRDQAPYSRYYRVSLGPLEIAFLTVDYREDGVFEPYTLFVVPSLRKQGYGTRIMEQLIAQAREGGFHKVSVYPRHLDDLTSDEQLHDWYHGLGFRWNEEHRVMVLFLDATEDHP